ncbi:SH3 domain-containing protein [Mesorhizobium sp. YC-39]|uniref:SH3 domain-containing protein n=1 Tax=unclassified Mesorhizobium TaxID=325217 RepID=UPI0021E7A1D8|nr:MULTISPECIES: SH3 domain-containing protein [unclassified Mesorhizobium]MCV3205526.1 SH3 domain-containing protein [Mesorhizobium sp. YC-2]MCV3228075.1 SH3 domain-containing protein [Mesorhizobium sp. YC-39]
MREPFSFGMPERRRFAMQFGYDMRPTFWQGVRSNSHLVIAALGTAALLGVAAVALWLALPASERQAVASPEQTVPTIPVKTTKIIPAATTAAALPRAAAKGDAVSPVVVAAEAEVQALAPNDPRWTGSKTAPAPATDTSGQVAGQSGQAAEKPAAAAAFADPAAKNDAATMLAKVAAPGKTATDGAQTAAIPAVNPQAQDDSDQAKAKSRKAAAAATGRILRAVTMRTGPKKNAAAMVTVPAKTSVQVMGCKQWCQIVYNGKRGWIYKSYIKTGA